MKKLCLIKGFLSSLAMLSLLIPQAFGHNNFPNLGNATLEIKAISGKSGFISCHSPRLQSCTITLSYMTQVEGIIVIKNTSANPAFHIMAFIPSDWTNVIQPSICEVLNPNEECSVSLKAIDAPDRPLTTIELKGTNTNSAFFDLRVIP